jgi:ribonuclease P protein component
VVLPQRHRLRGKVLFDYLYQKSRRLNGAKFLLLRIAAARPDLLGQNAPKNQQELRFAVVISSKVSKRAVVRNRLRRMFHQHFVALCRSWENPDHPCPRPQSWLLLSLKPEAGNASCSDLLREWEAMLQQAGFLDDTFSSHHPAGRTFL